MTTKLQLQKPLPRLPHFCVCALVALAFLTPASAQRFTLEATANTASGISRKGVSNQVYSYVDFASLGNNMMVTAVEEATTNALEVTVWQYVPPCPPNTICNYATNTIVRKGSMSLYTLIPSNLGPNFHIAALSTNAFVTVGLDAINSQVHVTSWTVDSSGNPHDTSDVYSTPGGSIGDFCAVAAMDTSQIVVVESDNWSDDGNYPFDGDYVMSTYGIESNGTLVWQNTINQASASNMISVNIFKVNTAQVVTINIDNVGDSYLTSWAINPTGENIDIQTDASPPVNEIWSVAGVSTGPGTFMTAGATANTQQLQPAFWSVDSWGNFTLGSHALEYSDPAAFVGVGVFNGTPITATGGSSFRLDAWSSAPSVTDLATLIEGQISTPVLAQLSPNAFAVAFQNSTLDLEIQVFYYNPL